MLNNFRSAVICRTTYIKAYVLFILAVGAATMHAQLPQYQVHHPPYVQLGDAQLGGANDQMEILWQTIPAGGGSEDSFSVEYRLAGSETWAPAGINAPLITFPTIEGRINHSATITGLQYDMNYDYRVQHFRAGGVIDSFQNTFRTRLPPGDASPYTFVAYGDSATRNSNANFRAVQNQINQLDAASGVAFTLLLGDNAYVTGTHSNYDARFDPALAPELTQYIARRVDYHSVGNHDTADIFPIGDFVGFATRDNYSVPLNGPDSGLDAQLREHNYSFDYGNVHFATFDSNGLDVNRFGPGRLAN